MDEVKARRQMALDAIAEYNAEFAGGGEPPYPDWADAILQSLANRDGDSNDIVSSTPQMESDRLQHRLRLASKE